MPMTDRDKRAVKVGGVIAVVLVVALVGLRQLGKGPVAELPPISGVSGAPSQGPTIGPTVSPTASPTKVPSPAPVFQGRDPFSPPPIFATGSPGGGSPTTSGSPTTTGSPGPTTTGSPGPTTTGSPTTTPSNGSSTQVGGHTVVLIDTFTQNGTERVDVEVDGTVFHPAEGATFDNGEFEVRAVSGNCATFLFGDESFTLCVTPSK